MFENNLITIDGYKFSKEQYYGDEVIDYSLQFKTLTTIPAGFKPVVSGDISFDAVTEITAGFDPICYSLDFVALKHAPACLRPISMSLFLNAIESVEIGFQPVCEYLHMDNIRVLPDNYSIQAGGYINLKNLVETPFNFNIIAGREIHLDSVIKINPGLDLTTKSYLSLNALEDIPSHAIFKVGSHIDFFNLKTISPDFNCSDNTNLCFIDKAVKSIENIKSQEFTNISVSYEMGNIISVHNPDLNVPNIFPMRFDEDNVVIFEETGPVKIADTLRNYFRVEHLLPFNEDFSQFEFVVTDGEGTFEAGETLPEAKFRLNNKLGSKY